MKTTRVLAIDVVCIELAVVVFPITMGGCVRLRTT